MEMYGADVNKHGVSKKIQTSTQTGDGAEQDQPRWLRHRLPDNKRWYKAAVSRCQAPARPLAQPQHMKMYEETEKRQVPTFLLYLVLGGNFTLGAAEFDVCLKLCFVSYPFLSTLQVCAAALHSLLHPGSGDDCSLWSDLQRALSRHSVWAGPEQRDCWWDPS